MCFVVNSPKFGLTKVSLYKVAIYCTFKKVTDYFQVLSLENACVQQITISFKESNRLFSGATTGKCMCQTNNNFF